MGRVFLNTIDVREPNGFVQIRRFSRRCKGPDMQFPEETAITLKR